MLRLITIPISHYCEKARWALDRAGIPYREKRHIQGVHQIAARRAGGGDTVPVLVTPDEVLSESADILAWVDERTPPDRRLFPDDAEARAEVEALCRRFDEKLGPHGRRLMYIHVLKDKELVLSFNNAGVPRLGGQGDSHRMAGRRCASRSTGSTSSRVSSARTRRRSGASSTSRASCSPTAVPYLAGDRFSAADLTFAALAAPMVVPPEYTVALPQPGDAVPQEPRALVERAREHPAGQHALRMFREHRRELGRSPSRLRPGRAGRPPRRPASARRARGPSADGSAASPSTRSRIQAEPSGSPAYASTASAVAVELERARRPACGRSRRAPSRPPARRSAPRARAGR